MVTSDAEEIGSDMEPPTLPPGAQPLVFKHRISTRLWHWINALALTVLLMSGLMIFNAHPRLYWGQYGANMDRAWLEIGATPTSGYLKLGETTIPTTGVLGRWTDGEGRSRTNAFPGWATIPSNYNLALARHWHLAFAWVLAFGLLFYLLRSLFNGHIRKDLTLSPKELRPSHIWHDIKEHARLRFPTGEAALHYNTIQKITYIGVIFILIPLVILTGLTMSPGMNAAWPWLVDIFGGRQSARSLHFIAAAGLAAFFVVHILLVILAGPYNEVRSMITGKFRLPKERVHDHP